MQIKEINNLCNLYKNAIKDIPEWIPEDFKEVLESIEEVEKDPRMIDFRSEAVIDQNYVKSYEHVMLGDFSKNFSLIEYALSYIYDFDSVNYQVLSNFREVNSEKIISINKLLKYYLDLDFEIRLRCLRNNKIQVGKQEIKLSKFYNKVASEFRALIDQIEKIATDYSWDRFKCKNFDELMGKKDWDLRLSKTDIKYEIVFTTKYQDILGMSARSEWTSCQDIRPSKVISPQWDLSYAKQVIGSCRSKYIGIIYLTDKSNYENRGERMLYRSAVWIVRNTNNNKDVLWVQKIYPREEQVIRELFISELEKHIKIPIYSTKDSIYSGIVRAYKENIPNEYRPYDDAGFQTIIPYEEYLNLAKANPERYLDFLTEEDKYKVLEPFLERNQLFNLLSKISKDSAFYKKYAIRAAYYDSYNVVLWSNHWSDYKELLLKLIDYKKDHLISIGILIFYLKNFWEETPIILEKYASEINIIDKAEAWFINSTDKNREEIHKRILIKSSDRFPAAIMFMNPTWKEYKEVAIKAINRDPHLITHISPDMDGFEDLAVEVCLIYGRAIYASIQNVFYYKLDILQKIASKLIKKLPQSVAFMENNANFGKIYKPIILENLVPGNTRLFYYLPNSWTNDNDIVTRLAELFLNGNLKISDLNDFYDLSGYKILDKADELTKPASK